MTKNTRLAAIFDVDDTLCNTTATRDGVRRPIHLQAERWLAADPIPATVAAAKRLSEDGVAIVLVTARGEAFSARTRAQVESYGVPVAAVYARATGDNRVDWKVKTDALAAVLADGWTPVVAYDDKPRNLEVFATVCDTVLV